MALPCAGLVAACHEIQQFASSLTIVTLPAEISLPVKLCVPLPDTVRDAVVLTIAQALIRSRTPMSFNPDIDPGRLAGEALRHATTADTMASMFTSRPRIIKSADHVRDMVLLLVLTSPEHSIHDVDRVYHQFCSSSRSAEQAHMNFHIEADACTFLAKSLRTFAGLLTDIPRELAHVVELHPDAKEIPAVLDRILLM